MVMRRQNGFARSDRVSQQVRRELADLLRSEVKDPRIAKSLSLVTLTDVEVSSDYSHAKVFFTSLDPGMTPESLVTALQRLAGFLRSALGKRIRLHQIPQLHFHYDASVERGTRLSNLIDQAVASDHGNDPA